MSPEPLRKDPYLHCRFCAWKTLRFRGRHHGIAQLMRHVDEAHLEEWVALLGFPNLNAYNHRQDAEAEDTYA